MTPRLLSVLAAASRIETEARREIAENASTEKSEESEEAEETGQVEVANGGRDIGGLFEQTPEAKPIFDFLA